MSRFTKECVRFVSGKEERSLMLPAMSDGVEAVLPVSKIKNFQPKDRSDIGTAAKDAFWTDGVVQGYYRAQILFLGETKKQLLAALSRQRKPIPTIFDKNLFDDLPSQPSQAPSINERRANARTAQNKGLREILRKNTPDDELVPKRLLDEAHQEITRLKDEIQQLHQDLKHAALRTQHIPTSPLPGKGRSPVTFTNLQSALRCMIEDPFTGLTETARRSSQCSQMHHCQANTVPL
ncbi:uncharacterized protein LOC135373245 isoform X2 [Ornithodoros turicata]|uniref:uncharacterized protein LOC135373245 isoform X2 n=1 Tax=Ornithodoros turicata TaxID=34597 RepID=UPI0031396637